MGRHLLYVEDEEADVYLLNHFFQELGLRDTIRVVVNGEQAILYLSGAGDYADRERFPLPCVVLLDINLPRKNGFEFLEWRRKHPLARTIPVVVFTSSGNAADVQRAYELGAAGYLTKITNPHEWPKRACAIRDFWLEQNTPPPGVLEA